MHISSDSPSCARILFMLVGVGLLLTSPTCVRAADSSTDSDASYSVTLQGSTTEHRPYGDTAYGEVAIYVGGSIQEGAHVVTFDFLFDKTNTENTSGYITPILFEQTSPGIYAVIGIGKGFTVMQSEQPQVIPFAIIEGAKVPRNPHCTFGFINALFNTGGALLTSLGAVDHSYPADGGLGLGGPGTTNSWGVTSGTLPSQVVTLGTTFGGPGADFPFAQGQELRTYSANITAVIVTR
jgi:hypothetical protein